MGTDYGTYSIQAGGADYSTKVMPRPHIILWAVGFMHNVTIEQLAAKLRVNPSRTDVD